MLAELDGFRATVLENAALRPGDTVVDVGAGTGLLTLAAAEHVAPDGDVLAVDVSADALEELRRLAASPNIAYLIGSADVLPLVNASADVVLTRSVLIYVDDKAEAAREFFRILRSGGRVSLFEPINSRNTRLSSDIDFGELRPIVEEWERDLYENPADPMLNFDVDDLVRFFTAADFCDVAVDVRTNEMELSAERLLTVVGAPGRKSLLEVWRRRFRPDEVDALVGRIRARETIRRASTQVYLTAVKR